MPQSETSSFRDMKQILSELEPNTDTNKVAELKERTHSLCARFLGGAWKLVSIDELHLQRLRGGMSNMLFLCRLPDVCPPLGNEPDKVLIRVYFNPETESHLVAESVIFTLLSERHLGPKLYGVFCGGRLEEYIPSRPLSWRELEMKEISCQIAQRLVRIHQLEVPIWKEPVYMCDALSRWLKQLMRMPSGERSFQFPEHYWEFMPQSITCADLINEFEFVRECLSKSESVVRFCHNDLQEGNILLPRSSSGNIRTQSAFDGEENRNFLSTSPASRLVIIDFEYASYNYRGFDFANHFVEYTINYDVDTAPFYEIEERYFPDENHQMEFFMCYLGELDPSLSIVERQAKAKSMIQESEPFIAVSHFFWGVWGLLQVELSPVGFGFAEYGRDRLGMYFKNRHLLQTLHDMITS